jgi:hypothetical protein
VDHLTLDHPCLTSRAGSRISYDIITGAGTHSESRRVASLHALQLRPPAHHPHEGRWRRQDDAGYGSTFVVTDGKISRWTDYWDTALPVKMMTGEDVSALVPASY